MKIPNKVKIGAHSYKVVVKELEGKLGELNREKGLLVLEKRVIPSERYVAFIHEVLHGINTELEHETVDALAQQLTSFLLDNKLLK